MIRRLAVALSVAGLTAAAYGQTNVTLTDKATTVGINAGGVAPLANTGVYKFETNTGATTVDDLLHMVKQSYYYRIGSGPQVDFNSLTPTSVLTSGTNSATVNYSVPGQFTAKLTYGLTGGAVGTFSGTLSRSLQVVNTSGAALDFHVFDYTDMNLTGLASTAQANGSYLEDARLVPDKGQFVNAQTAKQWDEWYSTTVTGADVTVNAMPSRVQMGDAAALRTGLDTTPGFNLAFASGAVPTAPVGGVPGNDIAMAFQWDMVLAASGRDSGFRVGGATTIVPEPGSIALLAGGVALVFGWRRRKA